MVKENLLNELIIKYMAKIVLTNLTDAQASAIATSLDNEDASIIDSINDILSDSKLPFIQVDEVTYGVDAVGASRHVVSTKPVTSDIEDDPIIAEDEVDDVIDADTDTFGFDDSENIDEE